MPDSINYRLGLAIRRADKKFEQAGGDTTAQWIPFFMDELKAAGIELSETTIQTSANLRESVNLKNIGGGSFRVIPTKPPKRD